MIRAECIAKYRDKRNKIVAYKLRFETGEVRKIPVEVIVSNLKENKMQLTNASLSENMKIVTSRPLKILDIF